MHASIRKTVIKKKKKPVTNVGNDVEKLEPTLLVSRVTLENSLTVSHDVKYRDTVYASKSTPSNYARKMRAYVGAKTQNECP